MICVDIWVNGIRFMWFEVERIVMLFVLFSLLWYVVIMLDLIGYIFSYLLIKKFEDISVSMVVV